MIKIVNFIVLFLSILDKNGVYSLQEEIQEVFSWKQIYYDLGLTFPTEDDSSYDSVIIPYNNIPIGLEVYEDTVFVTVPRRRHGIPSTLNHIDFSSSSPLLKPYPDSRRCRQLVSVYRPRVDACGRLWAVDTGLLEYPDATRKQVKQPTLIIYDLKTDEEILRYIIRPTPTVIFNETNSGGLTSIAVEVTPPHCDRAYAYITDLSTGGLIVFDLKNMNSWKVDHPSFKYDPSALNFTAAGFPINWRDGLFSVALADPDSNGRRKAYYHPLASTNEYSIYTDELKRNGLELNVKLEGNRGANSQSGSHAYHSGSRTVLFANVARDGIMCWNVDKPLTADSVAVVAQDAKKLAYISDLKIYKDEVWLLVNQMPKFIYSKFNKDEPNFFILKGNINNLIKATSCV